ncbi:signal peptide peptidase SppA [Neoehrlichia mikurensis]|uniref:Signal peptide peptidase SppA n=1 Tax=Neoehrlichia mikurensis TaxID=89586 RepID=A0A9Q9BSJ0_9RICK|nr:signal peptide peptidase SppA [Neoehrlichia mikurensis]QXK91785.1 signal peptide peptidase SppA [Neoehrlichia mikurensis]QXK92998.1 signal peptide peptidase SppA [Neoehrlichia mikurensis]QXK93475.1 signal peptide peptidase SppA [Neoehrlichia mikurensis]UTO55570.1 signal peptide peptidase SppA [Neoehrlichia mikurensis]UTO56491.1 signal peptide peptidase SppA [Neoehrlichia mikurensis]
MSDQLVKIEILNSRIKLWRTVSFIVICLSILLVNYVDFSGITNTIGMQYIAQVTINEEISQNDNRYRLLKQLAKNDNAKALILIIDSPGGSVVDSEILYQQIRDIAQKKPVVAVLNNLAASGGYMAAIAADYIIAHSNTLTGSIGVIAQYIGIAPMAKKLGISLKSIKTSELKAAMSYFEELTPNGEKAIQNIVNESYKFFVDLIVHRRKLTKEHVLKVADGRVYTGSQAIKLGLVDRLGGEKDAIEWLKKQHNIKISKIKSFSYKNGIGNNKSLFSLITQYIHTLLLQFFQNLAVYY